MLNFVAMDFETATRNMDSACAVGIAAVHLDGHVDLFQSYLYPPDGEFSAANTAIHGITAEQVENAPTFDEIWPQISYLFAEHVPIVAHNAHFDMSVLKLSLHIDTPSFYFVDSIAIMRYLGLASLSLSACASAFGIANPQHHDAANDAEVCANITIAAQKSLDCASLWELIARYSITTYSFSEMRAMRQMQKGSRISKERYIMYQKHTK